MASTAAPGRLEIVRCFVNTVEPEDQVDLLGVDGTLLEWCADNGIAEISEEGRARLRAFREALRAVLESNSGDLDRASAWRLLEPFTELAGFKVQISEQAGPVLTPQGSGAELAIAGMFVIIYDAMHDGTWPRLKACRKSSCRWAFYDRSKNGSGAWCSMRVCGNRVKAQRRRAREKT